MAGAGLLAVLAASCCVLPLALAFIGIGGSWISMLGPFVDHRGLILLGVLVVLAWAWVRIWRQWHSNHPSGRSTAVAVFASLAFVAAASAPLWEREATQMMWKSLVDAQ